MSGFAGRWERGGRPEVVAGDAAGVLTWDAERGRGMLVRDRAGGRGLAWAVSGSTLVFAEEVAGLLALLPRTPGPDPVAVAHWLARTGVPEGRTLYAGVRVLAPGERLLLDRWPPRPERWWRPRAAGDPGDDPEAFLREALDGAVRRAVAEPAGVGVLLSGGLDSGAVAALAARHAAPPCWSRVFPDHPEIDEGAGIAATLAATGLEGVRRPFRGAGALAAALEHLLAHRVPPAGLNGFVWRDLLREAAAEGTTILLDGEGGDELLGCSPYLVADALRAGRPDRAVALARRLPGMGADPRRAWVAEAVRRYGVRGALPHGPHAALRRRRAPAWLAPETARCHRESHDPWAWKRVPGPRWSAWVEWVTTDGAHALGATDHLRREGATAGVAFRHPLRDPELLEAVLALDPELGFDPVLDRPLARRALRGLVPDEVRLSERKPHFNALLEDALRGPDAALVEDLLGDGARVAAYADLGALRQRAAELRAWGPQPASGDPPPGLAASLFRALLLECWLRLPEDPRQVEELLARAGG